MIDDTLTALGTDIMDLADRFAVYLQTARSGNNNLDMALDQLDQFNKRFAKKTGVRKAIPESPIS